MTQYTSLANDVMTTEAMSRPQKKGTLWSCWIQPYLYGIESLPSEGHRRVNTNGVSSTPHRTNDVTGPGDNVQLSFSSLSRDWSPHRTGDDTECSRCSSSHRPKHASLLGMRKDISNSHSSRPDYHCFAATTVRGAVWCGSAGSKVELVIIPTHSSGYRSRCE